MKSDNRPKHHKSGFHRRRRAEHMHTYYCLWVQERVADRGRLSCAGHTLDIIAVFGFATVQQSTLLPSYSLVL